jgi:hypothetical protein
LAMLTQGADGCGTEATGGGLKLILPAAKNAVGERQQKPYSKPAPSRKPSTAKYLGLALS